MDRKTSLTILIAFLLASCSNAEIPPTPTSISIPTAFPTPSPTEIPAIPTETGPREGDVTTVTENGHEYKYTYTKLGETEDGETVMSNVREVANFPLLDYPYDNFMPYKILITEKVKGERILLRMTHKDNYPGYGLNINGTYDPTPIKAGMGIPLRERYFSNDTRQLDKNQKQEYLYNEMLGNGEPGHEQAYLPIIFPSGGEAKIKLSNDTGIILTIMDKDTILKLGGDRISEWSYSGIQFYSEVYGVDEKGNMLARMAIDESLSDDFIWEHTDQLDKYRNTAEILRVAVFSIPANLVLYENQGEQGVTDFAITLGHVSTWVQADGITQDLVIERVLAVQP